MSGSFSGKVALVTGGNSGIGRAAALAFAREGARVVVAARRTAEGEETAEAINEAGGEAVFVRTDVSDRDDVRAMIRTTIDTFGRLDCAFNNAAFQPPMGLTAERSEEVFARTIGVNLTGLWYCLREELQQMTKQGGGAIVNTSSAAAMGPPIPGASDYVASKYGVIGLSRTAAVEYAKKGIRINVICPGPIRTAMLTRYFRVDPDQERKLLERVPAGRVGSPEEVAEAVLWLCSEAASFVYGHVMEVDGGQILS